MNALWKTATFQLLQYEDNTYLYDLTSPPRTPSTVWTLHCSLYYLYTHTWEKERWFPISNPIIIKIVEKAIYFCKNIKETNAELNYLAYWMHPFIWTYIPGTLLAKGLQSVLLQSKTICHKPGQMLKFSCMKANILGKKISTVTYDMLSPELCLCHNLTGAHEKLWMWNWITEIGFLEVPSFMLKRESF